MLKIPVLLWERAKPSGKIHLCKSLKYRWKQQVWWPSSMEDACVPTHVPLPRCCFRVPLLHEVTKKNLFSAFHPWVCGCFCVLPVLAHKQGEESVPCAMLSSTQNVTLRCTAPCFVGLSWSEGGVQCTSLKMSEDSGYKAVTLHPFLLQHTTSSSVAMENSCSLWLVMATTKWRELLNKFFHAFWLLSHQNQVKHHRKMTIWGF